MTYYLSRVSPKGQITIPAPIRRQFDIRPGDKVEFEVRGDAIVIIPLKTRRSEGEANTPYRPGEQCGAA